LLFVGLSFILSCDSRALIAPGLLYISGHSSL
jgi:hypothetical protein